MNDLEIFESLRPDVEALSDRDRARMRRELFRSDAPTGSASVPPVEAAVRGDLDRGLVSDTRPALGGRRLLTLAAACLIAVGVAAVWIAIGNRDAADPAPAQQPSVATAAPNSTADPAATDETTASQPTAPQATQALVLATALSADEWLTVPPDATDLEWQYAVDGDSGYAGAETRSDRIVYGTATDPELLIIHIHNPPLDPGIESGLWAAYPLRDGWIETRQLGDTEITVQAAESIDPAIADLLIATPEQMLATEPLGVRERATPVATATHDGQEWTVLIERSGRYQMAYVEMRPSTSRETELRMMMGPEPIPPGEDLTVDYQPSAFAEGLSPGEVLAIGRAPSNVSSVHVEFSDGTVVTAATNPAGPDTSDRYWVALTSLAGGGHDISVTNLTAAGVEGR